MKISKIFHWLYFTVMMLPCVIIPIFAIYTRNENYNSNIELQIQNEIAVDFNQTSKYTNLFNANYVDNYFVYSQIEGSDTIEITQTNPVSTGHILLVKIHLASFDFSNNNFAVYLNETQPWTNTTIANKNSSTTENLYTLVNTNETSTYRVILYSYSTTTFSFSIKVQTFDLTQMFGEGNEPSIDEFNLIFTDSYYPYVLSKPMLVNSPYPTIYNDTDVGSQFVYTLYNATDKYFNCTNLFNLEQVWNWVQLNLFSGNAPLMVYVVWQVIVYEFFMDLIFLLYSVFMFVIDFATNCIDRFTGRANR